VTGSGAVAGVPSDNDTLQHVLAELADDGWDSDIEAQEGGPVRFRACGHTTSAAELEVAVLRRMEGASDPDDMLAVVAASCPHCGTRGVLVAHYGPTADPGDADVLAALPE